MKIQVNQTTIKVLEGKEQLKQKKIIWKIKKFK